MTDRSQLKALGGSDAAALVGLSRWATPLHLYYRLTGQLEPVEETEAMYFGKILEATVAHEYRRRTGRKVRRVNTMLVHPDFDFIVGHIDRAVVGNERILECKTARSGEGWGPDGSDVVPAEYICQVQWYLGLTQAETADIAVLIGGNDFRMYEIGRDQSIIDNLFNAGVKFWTQHVTAEVPPPIIGGPDLNVVKEVYKGTDGSTVQFGESALLYHQIRLDAIQKVKQYQSIADGATAHLMSEMGEAAIGVLPNGVSYTRKLVSRKAYSVEPSSYIDFRMKKAKGDDND